ncbi:MAG: rhodanese-like domain-containing protein [Rhizobiales bacterium]|nr:rhodanese-like domain-containing protein [Hyphomicrobiales bacterium]
MIALTRRAALALALAAAVTPALAQGPAAPAAYTPKEAFAKVEAGEAILVDIRTPEEWADTGVPKGAHKLDMTDPQFLTKLATLRDANKGKTIALICRSSNRSEHAQKALAARGWTNVVDVAGGLAGSKRDPGWAAAGLPMQR